MYQYQSLKSLESYFKPMMARPHGVYCCRLSGYNPEVKSFIQKFYDTARKNGVIIEGGIPNPDTRHIDFYTEMMGTEFQMKESFIQAKLPDLHHVGSAHTQTIAWCSKPVRVCKPDILFRGF